ncbi:putative 4-hydroxy-4-methyl-2-oxoglutarate aldolase, partial [Acinetobacter baumannii]
MSTVPFVTCDLLDDNPEKDLQVVTPSMDGKFLKSYGARQTFGGQVV